jgi:hypothetical protein
MKYYRELINSYVALNEAAQLDPQAKQLADTYISRATPNPIEVRELGGQIWKTEQNTVVFNGFTDFRKNKAIKVSGDRNPNYFDFVKMFSSGQEPQGEAAPDAQQEGAPEAQDPTAPQPGMLEQPGTEQGVFVEKSKFLSAIDRICKAVGLRCRKYKEEYDLRLASTKPGSLHYTISRTRFAVAECEDDDGICKATKDETLSTASKDAATKVLERAYNLLTKEDPLTLEEANFLKKNINISKTGQILVVDRFTGKGMMITQSKDRTTFLLDTLRDLSKTKMDPETNTPLNLMADTSNFLKNASVGAASNATIRGFFYEDVRQAAIQLNKCKELPEDKISGCQRKATEHFQKWLEKKDKLSEAFKELIDQYRQDGEVAIDLDNSLDMFMMNTIIQQFANGDMNKAEEALNKFSKIMLRLGQMGSSIRNPDGVIRSSTDVGGGRRADIIEVYSSREKAAEALNRMGLGEFQEMIRDMGDGTFGIGDSLKFSTEFKTVVFGRSSISTITGLVNGTGCDKSSNQEQCLKDAKEHMSMLTSTGLTKQNLSFVSRELEEVSKARDAIQNIPDINEYVTEDGKVRSRPSRTKFLESVIQNLNKEGLYGDLTQETRDEISAILSKSSKRDWKDVSQNIAKVLQMRKMENMLKSNDPQQQRAALTFMVGLAAFGGGASDNSMMSVVDAKSKSMYCSNQNNNLQKLFDTLKDKNFDFSKIKVNAGSFVLDEYKIDFDGNQTVCHVDTSVIERNSKKLTLERGSDPASAKNESNLILTYLKNQQKLLEQILSNYSQR